eukprot:5981245-Pleurochrysis_carterae.AAC.1
MDHELWLRRWGITYGACDDSSFGKGGLQLMLSTFGAVVIVVVVLTTLALAEFLGGVVGGHDDLLQVDPQAEKASKFSISPSKARLLGPVQANALLVVLQGDLKRAGTCPTRVPPEAVAKILCAPSSTCGTKMSVLHALAACMSGAGGMHGREGQLGAAHTFFMISATSEIFAMSLSSRLETFGPQQVHVTQGYSALQPGAPSSLHYATRVRADLHKTQRTCVVHAVHDDLCDRLRILMVVALQLDRALKVEAPARAEEHVHKMVAIHVVPAVDDDGDFLREHHIKQGDLVPAKPLHRIVKDAFTKNFARWELVAARRAIQHI